MLCIEFRVCSVLCSAGQSALTTRLITDDIMPEDSQRLPRQLIWYQRITGVRMHCLVFDEISFHLAVSIIFWLLRFFARKTMKLKTTFAQYITDFRCFFTCKDV